MLREKNTPVHFLTIPPHPPAPHAPPDSEEFHECDVVWNDHDDDDNNSVSATVPVPTLSSPRGFTAGISAALLADEQPGSPTSVQRKTTSSPVSMISSSLLAKSNVIDISGGPVLGSYYGKRFHMSAPVNVPVWPNRPRHSGPHFRLPVDEEDDGEAMVPPHEIVARSHNNMITFSVFEGAGRTLKGRDLTAVRNAVFQKTGFFG